MPARDLMHLVHGRPHRDVNLLSLVVQMLPCHWHPMFPADRPTDVDVMEFGTA